jgi:hypothetical protein
MSSSLPLSEHRSNDQQTKLLPRLAPIHESQAEKLPSHIKTQPVRLQNALLETSRLALNKRADQLRNSDSYTAEKLKVAFVSLFPLSKILYSIGTAEAFADQSLEAFGLSDAPGLGNLAKQLKLATSGQSTLVVDLLKGVAKLSAHEIMAHTATHVATEGLHLAPVVGQLANAGAGYLLIRKRMIRIIDNSLTAAQAIHGEVLIPVIVKRTS